MEQNRRLKSKSDDITEFLWTSFGSVDIYYACYLPSVIYHLACSSLIPRQLDTVQFKAVLIIVPQCGYNRNTRKETLDGLLALGFANFRQLSTQQGLSRTVMFLKQWRKSSIAGKLLRIAVAWFQVQVGVSYSFLENVKLRSPT